MRTTWELINCKEPRSAIDCFIFDTMFRITMTEVECFDPLSHAWSECDHLPESRSEAGAVII